MPILGDLPLHAHLDFLAETADGIAEAVHTRLSAKAVEFGENDRPIKATGSRFELDSGALWSCCYGVPLLLSFPETRDLRVQFHRRGAGATHAGKQTIAVTEHQACVYAGPAQVEFGADFAQVVWRVSSDALERKLSALTGSVLPRRLEFDPVLDLQSPEAQALLQLLETLLDSIDAGTAASTKLIQSELENALIVALLCSARHSFRDWLNRECPRPAPRQVRRAESFIEANWDKPITLEEIVEASGTSARSVFRGFKEHRGYSPLQFVKHVRLQQAKRLLQTPDTKLTVTQIAIACGFADISQFSKDFTRTFGLPPATFRKTRVSL